MLMVASPTFALTVTSIKNAELRSCLTDSRFVKLSGDVIKAPGQSGYYALPDEEPLHPDGIYSMELMQCAEQTPKGTGMSCAGFSGVTLVKANHGLSKLECARIAMSYAHDHFGWLFKPGLTTMSSVTVRRPDLSTGVWTFTWFHPGPQHDEDLHVAEVSADIRALDGKVVGFQAYRSLVYPPHRVTGDMARAMALKLVAKCYPTYSPIVTSVNLTERLTAAPYWAVKLQGHDAESRIEMTRTVTLDIQTGSSVGNDDSVDWRPTISNELRVVDMPTMDRMPIWTNDGLVFLSNRRLTDLPQWVPQATQAMTIDGAGRITYLTDALNSANPEKIDGQPAHSALNLQIAGRVYSVDLRSGKVLKTPTHNGNPDQQIEGSNFLVGSSKWAYFIGRRRANQTPGQTLYRVPVGAANTGPDDRQPEIVIALLPASVTRISQFGTTDRLLVQAKSGLFLIDGASKKLDDLILPPFQDTDLHGASITDITDGYVGPTQSTILFAGRTIDVHSDVRWRIYRCALDGSGLTALTPADDVPVNCHRFAQGPADAYDLTLTLLATAVSKSPDLAPDAPLTLPVQ